MPFKDYAILIVEDSGFQAAEVDDILSHASAKVVGPVRNLFQARKVLETEEIDAAVLDINLGKEVIYPFAIELQVQGVPFMFVSGSVMQVHVHPSFKEIPFIEKPIKEKVLVETLRLLLFS